MPTELPNEGGGRFQLRLDDVDWHDARPYALMYCPNETGGKDKMGDVMITPARVVAMARHLIEAIGVEEFERHAQGNNRRPD